MSKPTTAALIAAAEARATCPTGMAATRRHFVVTLTAEDAAALGIRPRLSLRVLAREGTVDLVYTAADGGYREISDEPSERERQDLCVRYARRNPIGAALELLATDLEWRATDFEHQAA